MVPRPPRNKGKRPVKQHAAEQIADASEMAERRHQFQRRGIATQEEIEAAKQKHKQEKNMRKKQKRGGTILPTEEYEELRAKRLEAAERNRYPLQRPQTFAVPSDVTPLQIKARDPELYSLLESGNVPKVTQEMEPYRARAMWFNEYDTKRTFNMHYHQCRMLFTILKYRQKYFKDLIELEELFVSAVSERSNGIETFDSRNDFVKLWASSDYDLHVFSHKDLKAFRSVVKDLREALSKVMSQVEQSEATPDMESLKHHMHDLDLAEDEDGKYVLGDPNDRLAKTWQQVHDEIIKLNEGNMTDPKRARQIEMCKDLAESFRRADMKKQSQKDVKDFEEMEL